MSRSLFSNASTTIVKAGVPLRKRCPYVSVVESQSSHLRGHKKPNYELGCSETELLIAVTMNIPKA
jgi:hypothetical protein